MYWYASIDKKIEQLQNMEARLTARAATSKAASKGPYSKPQKGGSKKSSKKGAGKNNPARGKTTPSDDAPAGKTFCIKFFNSQVCNNYRSLQSLLSCHHCIF